MTYHGFDLPHATAAFWANFLCYQYTRLEKRMYTFCRCHLISYFKAGTIMLVDLCSRKCVAELSAPQSIHEVEILQNDDSSDVLLTSFTGAQWIIPLENGSRSVTEVLTACIPSEFKKVEPPTSHLNLSTEGITILDTGGSFVELHSDLPSLASVPRKRFKVPPDTWLIHYTDSVLFAVSKQSEVRSAVHFGVMRLEFSIVKGACEWRPLGFVPLSHRAARLPSCLIINERGLIRIAQNSARYERIILKISRGIIFRELLSIFQRSVIPTLLSARRGKTLSPADLARLLSMAKTAEILRILETDSRSPLRKRVVELYVRRSESLTTHLNEDANQISEARLGIDNELSAFLSRHVDVDEGAKSCAEVQLWRSATLLASRRRASQVEVLRVLIKNGSKSWSSAVPSMRSLMMSCAANLEWGELSDQEIGALVSLLCDWQAALNSIAHHETCLRLALTYIFPKHCSILYLVSAMYIISDKAAWTQVSSANISCGMNGSAAITAEGQLIIWGDFTNQQNKPFENLASLKRSRTQQLPHPIHVEGRPRVVCCGAEHVLVLTSCGVGHSLPLIEGGWGAVRALSAGQFHSAILNTSGEVWTFGWGVWGQLGLGGRQIKDCLVPTKVEPIKEVSCGRVHTVLLTVSGKVLVAGNGSYGQLGTDEDVRKQYDFHLLPVDPSLKFVKIVTGFYLSIAITEDGRIFEWGRNPQEVKMRMFVTRRLRMAQLKRIGIPNMEKPKILLPMDTPRDDLGVREVLHLLDGQVVDASAGLSHVAVVTDQGSLFTWGKGLDFQLGHGNKTERSEPHILFDPRDVKWKLVACGGNHTIAVSKDGRTFGWGRNDYAQCGVPSDKTPSITRKYFYQPPKDGAAKRCVSLPDDASFVVKPTLIPEVELRFHDEGSLGFRGPYVDPALRSVASLAWEVVANHEDCQSKSILAAAFKYLPITNTQKRNSQLRRLWPMVWDEPGVQDALSADEKLDILETWVAPTKSGNLLEELEISYQIPVWARCSHVEPAVVGVPASDCSACAEEWADMIRTTLGNESVGR
ncbi:unnamed protein product [Haemonchus placei]|uniref:Uncharacterized protein n=1 Tax=Haemonchus placei TaxID=6290 RepID=A0A3P7VT59_HAEPC|nr:unnamed protein product [Haemonchus placei]